MAKNKVTLIGSFESVITSQTYNFVEEHFPQTPIIVSLHT